MTLVLWGSKVTVVYLGWHGVHKESEEPIQGHKGHVDVKSVQVGLEAWQLLSQ